MLRRHPLLLAEWLAVRNFLRRGKPRAAAILAAGIAGLVALAVVLLTFAPRFSAFFDVFVAYRVLIAVLIGIYAAVAIARRRQRAEMRYTQFWLAAAPVHQYRRTFAILVVTALPLAIQLFGVWVLLAAMGVSADVEAVRVVEAMLWVAGATTVGAAVGWWSARRSRAEAFEGSRYVGAVRLRDVTVPSSAALSTWPIAQVRAWGRPENLRVLVMVPALFGVQAGSSAIYGLSVVAIWVLAGYLGGLLGAVWQTASAASQWLRSTPIGFVQFAWAMTRRALAHQVIGTVLAVAVAIALGASWPDALYVAALWLAIVVLAYSIAVTDTYRSRPPLVRTAVSFATLAIVEARANGWSIPLAALLAAWHLRAGVRT